MRKNISNSFVSAKPEALTLKAGEHLVTVLEAKLSDSFHLFDGTKKKDLPEWADPTPILAIKIKGEGGSFIHNLNLLGFSKFMEMDDEFIKEYGVQEVNDYAIIKNGLLDEDLKDPDLDDEAIVRIPDPDRCTQCETYINRLMWAVYEEDGFTIEELLETLNSGDVQIRVMIEEDPYKNNKGVEVTGYKLTKFMPV